MTKNNDTCKINENRNAQSEQLKSRFSHLSNADLKFETGMENELLGRFESKLYEWHNEMIIITNRNKEVKG
jgi:alanine racemase